MRRNKTCFTAGLTEHNDKLIYIINDTIKLFFRVIILFIFTSWAFDFCASIQNCWNLSSWNCLAPGWIVGLAGLNLKTLKVLLSLITLLIGKFIDPSACWHAGFSLGWTGACSAVWRRVISSLLDRAFSGTWIRPLAPLFDSLFI